MKDVRSISTFTYLNVAAQLFQHHLLKTHFLQCISFEPVFLQVYCQALYPILLIYMSISFASTTLS
jgi:hypothetical protein